MRKIVLSVFAILIIATQAFAQNRQVTGTVSSENDGKPIPGAIISVKGTTDAVTTTRDGNYSITAPEGATLVFSFTGRENQEIAIGSRTRINAILAEKDQDLGNVVVTAYGTTTKEALVGSVSTLDAKTIDRQQISTVSKALEGTIPGVRIAAGSGQPGTDSSIRIRGTGSINAGNSALIVLDGAPFVGALSDINPNDIETLTASKDATSNSLYGSRAANGVIFVTTKRGRANTARVNFKATVGVNQRGVPEYNIIKDEGEFYEAAWLGIRNMYAANPANPLDACNAVASALLLETLGGYDSFYGSYTGDLVDNTGKLNSDAKLLYSDKLYDAMFRAGMRQEYALNVSGGTDKSDYYISAGYLKDEGYVRNSDYERYTISTRVNTQVKRWLKLGMSLRYSKALTDNINESAGAASNVFGTARSWAPIFPVHAHGADGKIKLDAKGNKILDLGMQEGSGATLNPDANIGSIGRPTSTNDNPMLALNHDFQKNEVNNVAARLFGEVTFLKDFKAKADYSYDYRTNQIRSYASPLGLDGKAVNGRLRHNRYDRSTINFNQILEYSKKIGDHSIFALVGHEFYKFHTKNDFSHKTDLFDHKKPNFVSAGTMQEISSGDARLRMEGYFFKADYNYANKYYASVSARRDGSSRFVKDRWGNFWSVGAAWRITQENFMEGSKGWLNELKLRASFGTQGNDDVNSLHPGLNLYGATLGAYWEFTPTPSAFGNPDLSWEKQKTLDIGLDFTIAKRLTGVIDFYTRRTEGMLFQKPLSVTTGIPYEWSNIGTMRNIGVEVDLNYQIFNKRDLQWSVGLNFAHNKNKIIKLPEEDREHGIVAGYKRLMEGRDLDSWYLHTFVGVDQDTGRSLWLSKDKDADGNYIPTDKDDNLLQSFSNKSAAPDLTGGFHTSFYYKGLDVSITTSFQLGGWTLDTAYLSLMTGAPFYGKHKDIWKAWDPANPSKYSNVPMLNGNDASQNTVSTRHLIKASYFNIRNIVVGYTFPTKWMDKIGIESIRVFVACDNAALFSKRKGFDPRTSLVGGSSAAMYSAIRTMSVGINVNF